MTDKSQTTALDAVARTKADPNRSFREDALVAEIERLRAALNCAAVVLSRCTMTDEPGTTNLCDCELSHNGMGMMGRECDCPAGNAPSIPDLKTAEPFPQPKRNDGGDPCGECHIKQGETCDICGAIQISQAVLQRIAARWVRERGRHPSDYKWFLERWRSSAGLRSYLLAQPEMQP